MSSSTLASDTADAASAMDSDRGEDDDDYNDYDTKRRRRRQAPLVDAATQTTVNEMIVPATFVIDGSVLARGESTIEMNVTTLRIHLKNLHHYTDYHVQIFACQNVSVTPHFCSGPDGVERSIISKRTLQRRKAPTPNRTLQPTEIT